MLIGIAVGLLTALMIGRALASQLFAVSPYDPLTYGVVVLMLALVAMFASLIPARRASALDPLRALRQE